MSTIDLILGLGVCCGGAPHDVRSIAEAIGKERPAAKYSPDMSKHDSVGTDSSLKSENVGYVTSMKKN